MVKLLAAFAVGVVAGLAVTWVYVLSLKATIRVCVSYIHDRLDQHALALQESQLCSGGSMKARRNVFSTTAQPQQRREQTA
jgi:hypothetical protein